MFTSYLWNTFSFYFKNYFWWSLVALQCCVRFYCTPSKPTVCSAFGLPYHSGHLSALNRAPCTVLFSAVRLHIGASLWLSWWRIHLRCWRPGSIPGLGRSLGEGKGCPLQYSCLGNSMDCIIHVYLYIHKYIYMYRPCIFIHSINWNSFRQGSFLFPIFHWSSLTLQGFNLSPFHMFAKWRKNIGI